MSAPTADAPGEPEVLWRPDPDRVEQTRIAGFRRWLSAERGVDVADYRALWEWSVDDLEGFWAAVADWSGVRFAERAERVLPEAVMPGARWFPGATLNYAEQALRPRAEGSPAAAEGGAKADGDVAVVAEREDGTSEQVTWGELRRRVAAARAGLAALGIGRGDRVVALVPNSAATLVAFLATASLGATWSSCSPDFGTRAVVDRFSQLDPVALVAVDGYRYGGKTFDVRPVVSRLRSEIGTLRATVLVEDLEPGAAGRLDDEGADASHQVTAWADLLASHDGADLAFEPVPFDHPLWVLFSSGTTGLPKGIVQGHGGIVLEHVKALALQCDLGPGDRFFWFTTTGWMMWNFLVSGLLVGSTVVLYDGNPGTPDLGTLWRTAERVGVTYFGTSAPYVQACRKAGLRPRDEVDLSRVRTLGSTGAPLAPEGFAWIAEAVGEHVQIASVSGGTDLCTAFVGAAPDVPVWLGELSCPALGAAAAAFDESGRPVVDEVGELVITKPMPSMPVAFWDDPDGSRLREAYFEDFPGVWRHGDWVRFTPRGSAVIYGRSDSTLNRGGVRMGTSEFYRVVEGFDEVLDSLVIDTSAADRPDGELLCFLVLADGADLDELTPRLRSALRSGLSPRHVPDRLVVVPSVPRTLNGKKCEVPVKRILAGVPVEKAVSREALADPDALQPFLDLAGTAAPG